MSPEQTLMKDTALNDHIYALVDFVNAKYKCRHGKNTLHRSILEEIRRHVDNVEIKRG